MASGVGTLTSATFLPFALTFSYLTKHAGIHAGEMVITAATLPTAAAALTRLITEPRTPPTT